MARYFTARASQAAGQRERADWWADSGPLLPTIHTSDHEATDTGIIDVRGNKIMRAANPLGFGRDEEWG